MKIKKTLAMICCPISAMVAGYMITQCEPFWRALIISVLIIISVKTFDYLKRNL